MSGRGGSLMEGLWIREVRRAAQRATSPFARQVALGCCAAAVGTMAASLLPLHSIHAVAKALWAAVWAVLDTLPSGPDSSFISCRRIDRADFATTTGLPDTMTPIPAVLSSWSSDARQVARPIQGST